VLDSSELLDVARLLAAAGADPPPTEAQLRRAVSTAYYALFHKIAQAGACRFMGHGHERKAGYALLYRGFNHSRMKTVCRALDAPRLAPNLERQLGRLAVSQDLREFARLFVALQEARHRADYDPHAILTHADAIKSVERADSAMQAFGRVPADEQADVLALLLANPRD
jgi:hypothetical protein